MANLIDSSYFIGPLLIGQSDQATVNTVIEQFITRYENEYFLKIMGYNFKKLYEQGLLDDVQKYKDIRDGKEYLGAYQQTEKWRGFKETAPFKRSPIANYVYFQYMRNHATISSGTGEVKANQQNSRSMSSVNKATLMWNEMVEWNKEFHRFMYWNQEVYPEFFQDLRNRSCSNNELFSSTYFF